MHYEKFWPIEEEFENIFRPYADGFYDNVLVIHESVNLIDRVSRNIVSDEEFLKSFINPLGSQGSWMFYRLHGSAGSGKTHLVRWIEKKMRDKFKDHPSKLIIVVPRNKGLMGCLKEVLHGLGEDKYDTMLDTANDPNWENLDNVMRLFKASLANVLSNERDRLNSKVIRSTEENKIKAILEFPKGNFIDFISDDKVGSYFVNHFNMQVKSFLEGRNESSNSNAVTKDHFKIPHEDLSRGNDLAREFYNWIRNPINNNSCNLFINFLNNEGVIERTFNKIISLKLQQINIQDLFRKIRREMHDTYQNEAEIYLLIEDFYNLTGLHREILEIATQDASADLGECSIKTLLAVTPDVPIEGFTHDTNNTRSMIWDIDETSVEDEKTRAKVYNLVGKYLNAARFGVERYRKSNGPLPDFAKTTDLLEEDLNKLNTFGRSDLPENYHLFPFNKVYLDKMCSEVFHNRAINPRELLIKVTNPILQQRKLWLNGSFPKKVPYFPGTISDLAPGPANFTDTVFKGDEERKYQYSCFIKYWLNNPWELTELSEEHLDLFSLLKIEHNFFGEVKEGTAKATIITGPNNNLVNINLIDINNYLKYNSLIKEEFDKLRNLIYNLLLSFENCDRKFKKEQIRMPLHKNDGNYLCQLIEGEHFYDEINSDRNRIKKDQLNQNKWSEFYRDMDSLVRIEHPGHYSVEHLKRVYALMERLSAQVAENQTPDFCDRPLELLVKCLYIGSFVLNLAPPEALSDEAKKLWSIFAEGSQVNLSKDFPGHSDLIDSCWNSRKILLEELKRRTVIKKGDSGDIDFGVKNPEVLLEYCTIEIDNSFKFYNRNTAEQLVVNHYNKIIQYDSETTQNEIAKLIKNVNDYLNESSVDEIRELVGSLKSIQLQTGITGFESIAHLGELTSENVQRNLHQIGDMMSINEKWQFIQDFDLSAVNTLLRNHETLKTVEQFCKDNSRRFTGGIQNDTELSREISQFSSYIKVIEAECRNLLSSEVNHA